MRCSNCGKSICNDLSKYNPNAKDYFCGSKCHGRYYAKKYYYLHREEALKNHKHHIQYLTKLKTKEMCFICGKYLIPIKNRRYCSNNCRSIAERQRNRLHRMIRQREYFALHKDNLYYRAKQKEAGLLRCKYGTSKLPMVVKKIDAIKRALKVGKISNSIKSISEGKTYEAYL